MIKLLLLPVLSLVLFALGLLLFFEILRPFREPNFDIPLALGCVVAGTLAGAAGLWIQKGNPWLNGIPFGLNLLATIGMLILFILLGNIKKLF